MTYEYEVEWSGTIVNPLDSWSFTDRDTTQKFRGSSCGDQTQGGKPLGLWSFTVVFFPLRGVRGSLADRT
jgi:hypothetical protein